MYHQHVGCSTGLSHQAVPPCHRVSGSMFVPTTQITLLLSLPSLQHVLAHFQLAPASLGGKLLNSIVSKTFQSTPFPVKIYPSWY